MCCFLIFTATIYSCNSTKYLEEGELLVVKNTVKIKSNASTDPTSSLEYRLGQVAKQKPNKKNFLNRRGRMNRYYRVHKRLAKKDYQDTTKIQKWNLENRIEEPVLYDRELMEESTETMTYYLNNLGYFYADVTADTIPHKRKPTVEVIYTANVRRLLTIDMTIFETTDDSIRTIISQIEKGTLLGEGKAVSKNNFNNEKNRITDKLQNMGFTYFYPNYIFFEGDTTETELKAKVIVTIAPPTDTTFHEKYIIGNVFIYTQYDPLNFRPDIKLDTLTEEGYDGFYLLKSSDTENFLVKPKPILNAFAFKKGDDYSGYAYDKTRKQLSAIEIYRFVRIRPIPSEENPGTIDFYVYMNPAKKMGLGADLELNSITNNITSVNNFGIYANVSFKHRNLLRGAEVFSISPIGGIELNLSGNGRLFNTIDVRLQSDLASTTIRNSRFKRLNESQLHLTTIYNYIDRYEQYQYNVFSLSGNIDKRKENSRFVVTPSFLNIVLPNIDSLFQPRLDENPLLARSFDRQFILGSNYNYLYNSPISPTGTSQNFQFKGELAGTLLNLANVIIRPDKSFRLFDTIPYSQYAKMEFDGNFTKRFSETTSWANRFNFGIGIPYGNSEEMPYVKQFFSGGDGSVRAWQVRELGPGAYLYPDADQTPFQTGNIKIEMNTELRFRLSEYFGFDGAFFVDAGNVWLLKDPDGLEREFRFDSFLSQVAIGSGFGVRKDFGFFVMRLDLGFKVRTPYFSQDNQVNGYYFPTRWWRDPNYVIAIGYPF